MVDVTTIPSNLHKYVMVINQHTINTNRPWASLTPPPWGVFGDQLFNTP
jgi:hypothetical protein